MQVPTFEYICGSALHDLALFITNNRQLIDLSSGWTISLVCVTSLGATPEFTKTTGFTGATGAEPFTVNGTPNLTISWDVGDLGALDPGTYICDLTLTDDGTSKPAKRRFKLAMLEAA
jgi:hypothetical protein